MCKHLISTNTGRKMNVACVSFGMVSFLCPSALLRVHFYFTHYDTVFANVDIGTDLRCVDNTVLLDKDMVSDVQWEECHAGRKQGEHRK